jgi:mevalonate pyrophosphate decarboxylase
LVKYWEKKDQIPANPSVSFTLNNCKTITKLTFAKKKNTDTFPLICFKKFQAENQKFLERIEIYLLSKRLSFYNRHTKYVPTQFELLLRHQEWRLCDEFHEFGKVLILK